MKVFFTVIVASWFGWWVDLTVQGYWVIGEGGFVTWCPKAAERQRLRVFNIPVWARWYDAATGRRLGRWWR